jgi:hypothetical protein
VVKIGANLGGRLDNAVVIRNWPTMSFEESIAPEPGTAIYSGNLGYGHDVELFVARCEQLRREGYRISMYADGRGLQHLPSWLAPLPLESDPAKLRDNLLRHEVHLVAANPRITQAIFPSKIWNSVAARRQLVCTGFEREMADELEKTLTAPFTEHIDEWATLLLAMMEAPQARLAVAAHETPRAPQQGDLPPVQRGSYACTSFAGYDKSIARMDETGMCDPQNSSIHRAQPTCRD